MRAVSVQPTIIDCVQGSDQWVNARLGVATASQFHRIVTPKGERSESSRGYMYELIAEMLLHKRMDKNISNLPWVKRGRDLEPKAAIEFCRRYNVELEEIGFIRTGDGRAGCSPDRLIAGTNEAVEIKCPGPAQHLQHIDEGPGKDYKQQVQGQMWIGGFEAVHFFSYFPGWPSVSKITIRDEMFIRMIEREVMQFL